MTITIQRPQDRFVTEHRLARLQALLQLRRALRAQRHRPRAAARQQRRHRRARVRASAPTATATWRSSRGCSAARSPTATARATAASLYPGLAQRMSAGSGIRHSEMNPSADTPAHFIQMWVLARHAGHQAGLRATRHQRRAGQGRPRADRVRPGPRRGDLDPPARRGAVGRAAATRRDGGASRRAARARLRRPRRRQLDDGETAHELAQGAAARLTEPARSP